MKRFEDVEIGDIGTDYNDESVEIIMKGSATEIIDLGGDTYGAIQEGISEGYIDPDQDCVIVDGKEQYGIGFVYGYDGVTVKE